MGRQPKHFAQSVNKKGPDKKEGVRDTRVMGDGMPCRKERQWLLSKREILHSWHICIHTRERRWSKKGMDSRAVLLLRLELSG